MRRPPRRHPCRRFHVESTSPRVYAVGGWWSALVAWSLIVLALLVGAGHGPGEPWG